MKGSDGSGGGYKNVTRLTMRVQCGVSWRGTDVPQPQVVSSSANMQRNVLLTQLALMRSFMSNKQNRAGNNHSAYARSL